MKVILLMISLIWAKNKVTIILKENLKLKIDAST